MLLTRFLKVLEKEQAKEIARTRAEAEEAERNRFMEELASAQVSHSNLNAISIAEHDVSC